MWLDCKNYTAFASINIMCIFIGRPQFFHKLRFAIILNRHFMGLFDFLKKGARTTETPLNTAVFVSKKIMIDNILITRIYHSSDNCLSFMDDYSANSNENIMLVSLENVLKKDESVKTVINIPIGHFAHRKNLNENWTIEKYAEEEDEEENE